MQHRLVMRTFMHTLEFLIFFCIYIIDHFNCPTAKPVRPKQLPVNPTNPFYAYVRATANTYSNALFQSSASQPNTSSATCKSNSVQSNP